MIRVKVKYRKTDVIAKVYKITSKVKILPVINKSISGAI